MYTASAVTISTGEILSLRDVSIEDLNSTKKIPVDIKWKHDKVVTFSYILKDDSWSLLALYIQRIHPKQVDPRAECKLFSCMPHYRKVELDGYEYISKNRIITRRLMKGSAS